MRDEWDRKLRLLRAFQEAQLAGDRLRRSFERLAASTRDLNDSTTELRLSLESDPETSPSAEIAQAAIARAQRRA